MKKKSKYLPVNEKDKVNFKNYDITTVFSL